MLRVLHQVLLEKRDVQRELSALRVGTNYEFPSDVTVAVSRLDAKRTLKIALIAVADRGTAITEGTGP
jgi:hypothetical protein